MEAGSEYAKQVHKRSPITFSVVSGISLGLLLLNLLSLLSHQVFDKLKNICFINMQQLCLLKLFRFSVGFEA